MGKKGCFETVRNLVEKAGYESRSKKRRQDFSRNRKMSFKNLMRLMLSMVKESTQNALERFFPENKRSDPHEPAGVQPGAAKSEAGGFSGIIPGERSGDL
jgi:hypothetical protein